MKYVHTADLHIGKMVNEFSMLKDQEYVLKEILDIIEEEKAQGIIIAGDIYDRSIPPSDAVTVLDSFLTELARRNIKVMAISGNHDSPERIGFVGDILREKGIHMIGSFLEETNKVVMEDQWGKVNLYLMPFAKPAVMKYFLSKKKDEIDNTYDACIKNAIGQINMSTQERNILVTHHFITNCGVAPNLSDSETRLSVGGTENVEVDAFRDFDYVALGHIHQAQKVGQEWIRYSGSPLKYSFSEVFHKKSVTIIDLKEKGNINIYERELSAVHDMRKIKGKMKELISSAVIEEGSKDDYIQVTLTDEEEIIDPIGVLRSVYPNVMQLILEKNIKKAKEEQIINSNMRSRSTLDIYQEFYSSVTGRNFDEGRRAVIINALEEIEEGDIL
jgi:DNA repair protein SbcD/Mre11